SSFRDARGLVELGIAFMLTALVALAVNFIARWIINFQIDLIAVGIYQSAFRLSGVYSNFITSAMGTDYYPRLAAVADDHVTVNRLVNEQTEIGLLFAIPGLFATLVYAPFLIELFYTAEFLPAAELLKWFVLGAVIRVISVPMGYIFVAKGLAKRFVFIETSISILHVLLIWYGIEQFGVLGVAIAYFTLYICYVGLMVILTWHLTGFSWSWGVRRLMLIFLPWIIIVFASVQLLTPIQVVFIGSAVLILCSGFCLYELTKRLGAKHRISRLVLRIPLLKMLVYRA
ncbi:MAG: oligosaccharide flippase family protein, partial [Endozoicomonadaceae bacterium]|nr:oligosaccharide flippase family protein [Endozoicomonadaceae bacterium]